MLYVIIILFLLAAMLGIYLLTYILTNKNTPKGVALTHGTIAGIGILCLIIYACLYHHALLISAGIFILAAMGGFYMMYRDITGKTLPKWLALGHGTIAITSFLLLIFIAFFM